MSVLLLERAARIPVEDPSRAYILIFFLRAQRVLATLPTLLRALANRAVNLHSARIVRVAANGKLAVAPLLPPGSSQSECPPLAATRTATVQALREGVAMCPRVDARYGVEVRDVRPDCNGTVELLVAAVDAADGEHWTVRSHLVVAADGRASAVVAALRANVGARWRSTRGFVDRVWRIASSRLLQKSILLSMDVASLAGEHARIVNETMPDFFVLVPTEGRAMRRTFRIGIFSAVMTEVERRGGLIGSIIRPPHHAVWRLRDVEEGYKLFEENFPGMPVRSIVTAESMQRFVTAVPKRFGDVRQTASLAARAVADDGRENAGVVVLGDAAHSFPPDLGQGVNSGVEDAGVLAAVVDAAGRDATGAEVAADYERMREGDADGLSFAARNGLPFQYQQNRLRGTVDLVNVVLRQKLSSLWPRIFYPAVVSVAMETAMRYGEIARRARVTTRRMWYCALVLAVLVVLLSKGTAVVVELLWRSMRA